MFDRRSFLQSKLSLLFARKVPPATGSAPARDFVKELQLTRFINAAEPFTLLSGAPLPAEVAQAWQAMSVEPVRLEEVHNAAGKRLASLLGCEAAMVTAGAASALTLGTAACITRGNRELVHRLPDTAGMKNEVIIQKTHRYGYDHAVRNCGIRYVEVETVEELERAVNDRTAMMHFFNTNEPMGKIKAPEFAQLANKHRVPALNDIAADVPPVSNFTRSLKLGFDLVAVSGGKGICGPQSCGLLYGRADLVAAARMNASPNSDAIGRGQKVNKEEIVAMMVAIELYLKRDHEADWRQWEQRIERIAKQAKRVAGVTAEQFMPEIHYRVPHLRIRWDEAKVKATVKDIIRELRDGTPSIEVRSNTNEGLELGVWMLKPGEDAIVAQRVHQVLSAHRV
ncbi:MAG: aminotransferase class V-fold PLP-dependent enzyme [Bryobacterales bacterium]|nr:aminotransferase class V-fold PLP-dependent enzyme [Bryobacterales bacterium]